MGDTLWIGHVASKTGLTRDTIRYYERLGLLAKPRRTPAGYRLYGESVLNRLTLIRNAQQFGFSLRDIGSFLRVRELGGKPCNDVRRAAETMLNAVDRQSADLLETRNRMQETLRRWETRTAEAAREQPASRLEPVGSI